MYEFFKITGQTEISERECYNLELSNVNFFFSLDVISKDFIGLTVVSHLLSQISQYFFSQINFTEILHRLTWCGNCNFLFRWRKGITYSAVLSYIKASNSVVTTPPVEVKWSQQFWQYSTIEWSSSKGITAGNWKQKLHFLRSPHKLQQDHNFIIKSDHTSEMGEDIKCFIQVLKVFKLQNQVPKVRHYQIYSFPETLILCASGWINT